MVAVLAIAVVAVAYGTQAPSFGVAEFAPAARQAPDAPPTTAGASDAKGGGARRSTTTTAPAPTATSAPGGEASAAPTTKVSRARQCYGDPPLQSEDPLSPACVATIFEGDNGGATSRGVSATEIRVAVPVTAGFASGTSVDIRVKRQTLEALFEYVNNRYELYGRRLVPVYVEGPATDALTSRALGAAVGAVAPFAAITGPIEQTAWYPQSGLMQELARNQVVTVARSQATWWSDQTVFDPLHPYMWSVAPSSEQAQGAMAAMGCALAGKPASHTADPGLVGKPRQFGIVAAGRTLAPQTSVLSAQLEACTGSRPVRLDWVGGGNAQTRAAYTKWESTGVTTVFCVCESHFQDHVVGDTHGAGYDPEMILNVSGWAEGDEVVPHYIRSNGGPPPLQVQTVARLTPLQARPWYQALLTTNPAVVGGDQATTRASFGMADFTYSQLLVLASGVQAAGPTLTPDTFSQGLMATEFPNARANRAPDWLPTVGFGPGDHSFFNDFAIGWWSDSAPAIEPFAFTPLGSWCYVGQGARFTSSSVPGNLDQLLFDTSVACR